MSYTDVGPEFDTETGQKDGAHPRFYMDTRQNNARSEASGYPCFDEVEMVEVMIPGDRLNTPVFIVNDAHRKRWPRQYAAFKESRDAPLQGTPLDQIPGMTASRIKELAYFHVLTAEQLAGLPDDLLMKAAPMDGRTLRDKAARWLEKTAGNAVEERLAAENRAKDEKIASMETNLASMQEAINRLTAQSAAGAPAPKPEG